MPTIVILHGLLIDLPVATNAANYSVLIRIVDRMVKGHFSCVVDSAPIFRLQALNWIWTAIASGSAKPDEIILHLITDDKDEVFAQILNHLHIAFRLVDRFGIGESAFCNKLAQLDTPELYQGDCILLGDTDTAFVRNIRPWFTTNAVRAKIADYPNPPLHIIERLYAATGIKAQPYLTPTSFSAALTFDLNCNGGVYIIPAKWISELSQSWVKWARFILDFQGLPSVYRKHADQLGFCFAMEETGIPFEPLPLALNFPTHFSKNNYASIGNTEPLVFHYHRHMDKDGCLLPVGVSTIDTAIGEVNKLIKHKFADLEINFPAAAEALLAWKKDIKQEKPLPLNVPRLNPKYAFDKVRSVVRAPKSILQRIADTGGSGRFNLSGIQASLVEFSLEKLGFFTRTPGRIYEYPWAIREADKVQDKRVLDIGAGISPLPLWFAAKGATVITVDNHPVIRTRTEMSIWNEWGYLDYAIIDINVASLHRDIVDCKLEARSFDVVYSISVLEHIESRKRRIILQKIANLLKSNGLLLLTFDLIPGTNTLWNLSEGKRVENSASHGDFETVITELTAEGFRIEEHEVLTDIIGGRTDIALIKAVKAL